MVKRIMVIINQMKHMASMETITSKDMNNRATSNRAMSNRAMSREKFN